MEWKPFQLRHTGRILMRGGRGGRESGVEWEQRTPLQNRRGQWQPKKRYKVMNGIKLKTGEDAGHSTFGVGL